jgi:hypothetical protein
MIRKPRKINALGLFSVSSGFNKTLEFFQPEE